MSSKPDHPAPEGKTMAYRLDGLKALDALADGYLRNEGTPHAYVTTLTGTKPGDGTAVGNAWADLREVRAATAELIEAAKATKCTPCHSTGVLNVRPARVGNGFVSCDAYPCPHCAPLRAALARIGGAK